MNIDITRLRSGLEDYLPVDFLYSFSKEQLEKTDILELNDVTITGEITKNNLDEYIINVDVIGTMVLPCSVSLKPVNYDFNIHIEENLKEFLAETAKKCENNQKTIDIFPIIWENILMEIPMKVVSDDLSDIKTSGDGWDLVTDEG